MFGFGNKEGSRPNFGVESDEVAHAEYVLAGLLSDMKVKPSKKLVNTITDLVKSIGCTCAMSEAMETAIYNLMKAKKEDFKRD